MAQFDVEAFIDRQKIGPRQLVVLLVCSLFCFIDAFDIFMVGKIAPAIAAGFGETPAAMKQVVLYQQIGLAIGAFGVAPLADRFGRRSMLVAASALFGIVTLATVWSQSLGQLALLRGLGAIFMSAGLPMSLALLAEMTPKARRSTFIAIALAVYSTGSAASGAIAAFLIDDYGWQIGFWIGGLVPLLCVPLMLLVPESLKFQAERNPADPAIARTIARLDPAADLAGVTLFVLGLDGDRPKKPRLTDIFSEGRAFNTSILWVCCFISMSNIALLANWLPTFFQEMAGVPIQRFAVTAMIAFAGGFVGTLVNGYLMDRIRPSWSICGLYIGLATSLIALSHIPFGTPLFLIVLTMWSFCQTGGQAGLNTLTTFIYPPRMRSTGLGWSGGAGRIGGIMIAPAFGSFALDAGWSLQTTLLYVGLPSLVVAMLVLLIGRSRAAPEPRLEPVTT
jgi:AAHS family 4-hydroxybenzoate transporter-like MFS transporter